MEKVVRDGKVAVVFALNALWSTAHDTHRDLLLFHPLIVEKILTKRRDEITPEWMQATFGIDGCHIRPETILYVEWVPAGERFYIDVVDGEEYIVRESECDWITA